MTKDGLLGALLILFAVMLDGFQFFIGLAFSGVPFVANFIPIIGQGVSMAGSVLGAAIDMCMSFSFGSMIVSMLIYFKMYYPKTLVAGSLFEVVPFVDIFPGWTAMVIRCVWKKQVGNKGVLGAAAGAATGAAMGAAGALAMSGKAANDNFSTTAANDNQSGAKMDGDIRVKPTLSHAA